MTTMPGKFQELCDDYQRIEKAIYFLETNYQRQPDLKEVSDQAGLSEYHFQRMFTRWAGISPKRFLQFLTKENAKQLLHQSSLLSTSYSVGLSSPGRLHDLFIHTEAVTPGEYKSLGAGIIIRYGFHSTPFGESLIGVTDRGICYLAFTQDNRETALSGLKEGWKNATLLEDPSSTATLIEAAFSFGTNITPVSLLLSGTNFQLKVWEALLSIPRGELTTYEQIATRIGQSGAQRAVGTAISHNPIAYLIPCHRVIHKVGDFGNYKWGPVRKKVIIGWESAQSISAEPS